MGNTSYLFIFSLTVPHRYKVIQRHVITPCMPPAGFGKGGYILYFYSGRRHDYSVLQLRDLQVNAKLHQGCG